MERAIPLLMDDSSRTTTAAAWVRPGGMAFSTPNPIQTGIEQTYWRQVEPQERMPGLYGSGVVSSRAAFFHNTLVVTTAYVSMVAATAQSVEYSYYQKGTTVTRSFQLRDLALPATALGYDTWTRPGLEPASPASVDFVSAIASIDRVIEEMRFGQSIVRSSRLLRLAERAAAANSETPEDVEAWARRLAEDVKDADD